MTILMTGGNIAIEAADLLWLISGLLGIIAILIGALVRIQLRLNTKNDKSHQLMLAMISSLQLKAKDVERNKEDVQEHDLQLHDVRVDINSQKQKLTKHELIIEENKKKAEEHNVQIKKIEADLNSHGQWLTKLNGKVQINERDIKDLKK